MANAWTALVVVLLILFGVIVVLPALGLGLSITQSLTGIISAPFEFVGGIFGGVTNFFGGIVDLFTDPFGL